MDDKSYEKLRDIVVIIYLRSPFDKSLKYWKRASKIGQNICMGYRLGKIFEA